MIKKSSLALVLVAISCGCACAQGISAPEVEISSDGSQTDLQLTQGASGWYLAGPANLSNAVIQSSSLQFDPDPRLNYGFGLFNDTGTTQTYTVSFPTISGSFTPLSINLAPGTYSVSETFGVTLTDGAGDGATFSQVDPSTPFEHGYVNSTDVLDMGTGTLTIPAGAPANQETQTFFFTGVSDPSYLLLAQGTTMNITTTFQLSPGDSASFSGSFIIEAAPEPSSLALGAIALGAFVVVARMRRLHA